MEITLGLGIFISAVTFLGFFIKGIAGFGDPLITTPLLSMKLDNSQISPMNLIYALPLNIFMAWKNRRSIMLSQAVPMGISVMLGVIPGTLMLKSVTSWVLKAALGVVILIIGVEMLTRKSTSSSKGSTPVMLIVSFLSGITAGLFGINLFFLAYLERTIQGREAFKGNITFIFCLENIFRMILYFATGVFTRDIFILMLVGLPGVILGFTLGLKVDKKLSERTVKFITIGLFMLSGLSVLIKAIVTKS